MPKFEISREIHYLFAVDLVIYKDLIRLFGLFKYGNSVDI